MQSGQEEEEESRNFPLNLMTSIETSALIFLEQMRRLCQISYLP